MSGEPGTLTAHPSPERLLSEAFTALVDAVDRLRRAERLLLLKDAELACLRSELLVEREQYRSSFDSSREGLLVTTFDGRILEANREAASLLGSEPALVRERPLAVFIAESARREFAARLERLYNIPTRMELKVALQPEGGEAVPAVLWVGTVYHADRTPRALRWTVRPCR
jgi:PAS domain S-box-containing protein